MIDIPLNVYEIRAMIMIRSMLITRGLSANTTERLVFFSALDLVNGSILHLKVDTFKCWFLLNASNFNKNLINIIIVV